MSLRHAIEETFRSTAGRFGYGEVATPTFEDADLFIRKSGPEIVEQLYLFRDKGDRELVLRPELTAPVIRFYANDLYKQPKPLKIFYIGNCFRYERPQKGRFREFWQFGAELIGTDSPEGIAELIAFACSCLSMAGLKDCKLRIGCLKILKGILSDLEIIGGAQQQFFTALDKGDIETVKIMLEDSGRTQEEIEDFLELVTEKIKDSDFDGRKRLFLDKYSGIESHLERLGKIVEYLRLFEIGDYELDLGIARGLDYYTDVVFEIDIESLGAEKQVCGGGEYSLNELFDIEDVACSGFAIGFDRVALAHEQGEMAAPTPGLDVYIIPLCEAGLFKSIALTNQLRGARFKVDLDIKGRNMSKNLKYASSRNAARVLFLGEDELKNNSALIREMCSGDQVTVKLDEVVEFFKKL